MTKKQTTVSVGEHITEEMLSKVEQIHELVRVRSVLSYGTNTDIRTKAQSIMSRTISKEVDVLSKLILQKITE